MKVVLKNLGNSDKVTLDCPLNLEFWVDGHRKITLSINETGTSIEIPSGEVYSHQGTGSFYAKHKVRH